MTEQVFTIGRDVEFTILIQDANGNPVSTVGQSWRLRIYPKSGQTLAPVVDVTTGAGITIPGSSPWGLVVAAGVMPGSDPSLGAVDLTRTDTGADLWATWPCRIVRAGTAIDEIAGNLIIRNGTTITLQIASTTPGIQGAQGVPGASSLVAAPVPLFPNGDFALWGRGVGPFDASGIICEGVSFTKGAGSTHAITRGSPLDPSSDYALEWARSVAGSGNSLLNFRVEDLRRFHGKTFLFSVDHIADAAISASSYVSLNYGSGGSATDTVLAAATVNCSTSPGNLTRSVAIDLTGKTLGPGNFLELTIRRTTAQPNGTIRLANLRGWLGAVDYGMVPIASAIRDQMCRRRFQVINTRTINGTTRVYFPVSMRAAPAITASVGTVSNITTESCDLAHTSAASTILTCDAEL